jgi:hypothetical protein
MELSARSLEDGPKLIRVVALIVAANGRKLWVRAINGDFIDGGREPPDGFMEITARPPTL